MGVTLPLWIREEGENAGAIEVGLILQQLVARNTNYDGQEQLTINGQHALIQWL